MSSRPIYPRELIQQAQRLVGRAAGAGRPRTIDLRTGISCAYYAAFHEITGTAAAMLMDGVVPVDVPPPAYPVARWFSHVDVRGLAEAVLGGGNKALRVALAGSPPELSTACRSFVLLQDARHLADYEHDFDVDRYSALLYLEEAQDALDALDALKQRDDPMYQRFLRLAGGSVRIARAR